MSRIITVTLNPALDRTVAIPRFQPGQVNRIVHDRLDPGGKGINVAKGIAALGQDVLVTGFLGRDNAARFTDLFDAVGIAQDFILLAGENRTNIKLVEDDGRVSELNFPGVRPNAADFEQLLEKLQQLAAPDSWLILAGSLPATLPPDSYATIIERLKPSGCRILLDSSGAALAAGLQAGPFAAKPNLPELSQLTGRTLNDRDDWLAAADQLLANGLSLAALSLGSHGALLVNKQEAWFAPALSVPVASTVGAGDAFVAGLAAAQNSGYTLADTLRLATATAAASVALPGTQAASRKAIDELTTTVQPEKWR